MLYVSRILDSMNNEMYHSRLFLINDYTLEITDSETKEVETLSFNDAFDIFNFTSTDSEWKSKIQSVYGLLKVGVFYYAWKVSKIDLMLYECLDYVKTERIAMNIPDGVFYGHGMILEASNYTFLFANARQTKSRADRNNHTLGAIISNRLIGKHKTENDNAIVSIKDNLVRITLHSHDYYYKVVDSKKFELLKTKIITLGGR